MGGDAGALQGPLGVAPVGPHHVFVGDDVGGVAEAQFLDVFAEAVDDAPTCDDGVASAGVVNGCGMVGGGHINAPSNEHAGRGLRESLAPSVQCFC